MNTGRVMVGIGADSIVGNIVVADRRGVAACSCSCCSIENILGSNIGRLGTCTAAGSRMRGFVVAVESISLLKIDYIISSLHTFHILHSIRICIVYRNSIAIVDISFITCHYCRLLIVCAIIQRYLLLLILYGLLL